MSSPETPKQPVWAVNISTLRVEGPIEAVRRRRGWYQCSEREQFGSIWRSETLILWPCFETEREAIGNLAIRLNLLYAQLTEARAELDQRRARLDQEASRV